MHKWFDKLYKALDELKKTIGSAGLPKGNFIELYGWNQTPLDSDDLVYSIDNLMEDIKSYEPDEEDDFQEYLNGLAKKITAIDNIAKGHYNNTGSHLLELVPNIAITILVIQRDLEKTFFNWKKLEDNKLLPRNLVRRLRATEARLENLDASSSGLEQKVLTINSAHEAAENLPTDLQELQRTQAQISELLSTSKEMLAEIQLTEKTASASLNNVETLEAAAQLSKEKTDSYVSECDEALQIATTEGLAGGFDQKAKELSNSITKWVVGLIIALVIGGIFGAIRVGALTNALSNPTPMSVGEGIIQAILTIFSIGGPLWFAWLATQQINQRFKLSEDYAYKATVAKSYTGFSKQANRFGPDVEERLFNTTLDRLEEMPLRLVDGKDYNSPWHEFVDSDVLKQAINMVPGLARELNTYAKNTQRKMPKVKIAANQASINSDEQDTKTKQEHA
ncbi:hypothetical protein CSB62_23310 [Vibrio splendidus]|nr:hypothetical protein CSB62_23310 [Vibrio splendidus]